MELAVNGLSFAYKNSPLLFSNVSFNLRDGDLLTILGPNGAGKTTLLLCLMNLLNGYQGSVFIDAVDVRSMSANDKAKKMTFALANEAQNVNLSVLDYICMGAAPYLRYWESPSVAHYSKAKSLCEQYTLSSIIGRKVSSLSQGEKQIITILRVLMQDSSVVLLDEPTSALDMKNQRYVLQMIRELARHNKIIIQVSHNPNHALLLGGKCLLMEKSGKTTYGDVRECITEESLRDLYQADIRIVTEQTGTISAVTFEI